MIRAMLLAGVLTGVHPQMADVVQGPLEGLAIAAKEMRAVFGHPGHGQHMVLWVGGGMLGGFVLGRGGQVRCVVEGTHDPRVGGCTVIAGCPPYELTACDP